MLRQRQARVLPVHYATKLKTVFVPDKAAPLPSPLPCDVGSLVITDTENKASQLGEKLVISGGKGTPVQGDPGSWSQAIVRSGGLALLGTITVTDATQVVEVGFDDGQAGALGVNALRVTADLLKPYNAGVAGPSVAVPADATAYQFAVILADIAGAFYLVKGGVFTDWTLLWRSAT